MNTESEMEKYRKLKEDLEESIITFKGFFIFWTIIILMFIMSNLFFSRLDNL